MKKTPRKPSKSKKPIARSTGSSSAKVDPNRYPKGWNRQRVQDVIAHYQNQSEDQAVAEDEAAYHANDSTMMQVPRALVPQVRKLLAKKAG